MKIQFTITAENLGQYADRLLEGDAEIWFRLGDGNFAYEAATNDRFFRSLLLQFTVYTLPG